MVKDVVQVRIGQAAVAVVVGSVVVGLLLGDGEHLSWQRLAVGGFGALLVLLALPAVAAEGVPGATIANGANPPYGSAQRDACRGDPEKCRQERMAQLLPVSYRADENWIS